MSDKVCVIVAGVKMVYQSIDLVEGHVFKGLEPHPINADGYRGYRIGQKAPEVHVNWLVHHGSYVEKHQYTRNKMKDNFAEKCKSVQINKVKAINKDELEVPVEV